MGKHKGKRFFVTGGNRGIGLAISQTLAKEGAQVAFSYSSQKESAEKALKSLEGEGHLLFQMNISDESSVEKTFESLFKTWPKLDGLVNNAGITRDQLLLRMKVQEFDEVINTNLRGSFLCIKHAAKNMLKHRAGSIVNITSVVGLSGNPGQANYTASKAGLTGFTKSIARELASRSIRVNCVAPGFVQTDMSGQLEQAQVDKISKDIPMNAFGKPEDIAYGVSFLLSEESSYITGHTLNINGGMYM